jgi:RHS repeat-associated protein
LLVPVNLRSHLVVARLLVPVLIGLLGISTATQPAFGQGPLCPTCQYWGVSVTPDGTFDPNRATNSTGNTTIFTVQNIGNVPDTYIFACRTTGGVACTNVSPTSWTLNSFQSRNVTVTYDVGSSGGTLTLEAQGQDDLHPVSDTGYVFVTTPPVLTLVVPRATNGPDTAVVHSRTPLILVTYSADAAIDMSSLVLKIGNDTVSKLSRRNAGLAEWEVDSAHQLTPGVVQPLYVRICHVNSGCASITRQIVLDNSGPPIVSFAGMPLEVYGGAAEVETGFGIPAYFSMGTARSAGLVYSTRQSYPRALVNADIELTWPTGAPDQIKAILRDGIVALDSLTVNTPSCQSSGGRRCRVTLQGDLSGSTYPRAVRKWLNVEVRVTSGSTTKITVDSIEVVLVDRRSSPYGSGWFVSGIERLDSAGADMIVVEPNGTATLHRGFGGVYLSPPGDTRTLVWTGSQWEMRFRFSGCGATSRAVFDTQGRLVNVYDCHGNASTITYAAVDRISNIKDPLNKQITFFHNSVTAKLDSIRDTGGRVSRVTINASSQLVYDSIASPPGNSTKGTFSYTSYGGNNTVVLASVNDALGQAISYTYNARRRAYQTTLPAVLPETGTTPVSPVVTYRPQVLRGLDTLLSQDSIFGQVREPRGFWTRARTNRWGGALRTWDTLGTVLRAAYRPDGRVLWTEGKVADSSRVYTQYDTLDRPIRGYRLRTAIDTVMLDSLVYDSVERIARRYDPLRQYASYTYNTAGDVLTAITPTGDTTTYQWLSNGQLDRVRAPLQTGWTIYTYDATWKNSYQVTNASGLVLSTSVYDTLGRLLETNRKLTVRIIGEPAIPDTMQWRRTRTWYDALNRVDSTRIERSNNCAAPCDTPHWILDFQQVKHVYDRLGRDTARVNTRGKRTRYAYDALGRVRARWPFADSAAVVDSFRYDIAGNLRFAYTRRGNVIEHRYDVRGRDTLTIVPGVGNYRQGFAGPGDQLTRAWIDSYSDPIGGVIPGVSWVYSQAGLVLADTAQGNRLTTYQYDRFGRDTLVSDVRGTWRMRYDAVRGVLDTVMTAYGDTVRWTIDQRGRAVGPYISNGANPDYAMIPTWDQVGKLISVRDTHTVTVGHWQSDSTEPDLHLLPLWREQHGSGGPTIIAQDTVAHDGWERVTAIAYFKDGAALASASYSFDEDANLYPAGESRSYDAATTRLMARAGNTYGYDRVGNLDTATVGSTGWKYLYDALERLIAVRKNGTLLARYAYDVFGRRIVKRVYSGSNAGYLRMIYRGSAVAVEADSLGTLTLGYTSGLGIDNLVAVHKYADGSDYYVVQDALHSVRGLSRKDGTWIASWRYGIYGAVLDTAGAAPFALRYRWTGREYDLETGLFYFRARYYDPATQRFVQEDPIGFGGGANLYAYSDGNPTNTRDPSGLRATVQDAGINPATLELLGRLGCWDKVNCGGSSNLSGGGGGGGGGADGFDPWGQEDDYEDRWERDHPPGVAHVVQVCNEGNCDMVVMWVKHDDYDPSVGHVEELVFAAARAAVDAGVYSFGVSSITCCEHRDGSAHYAGNAMDVSWIGNARVYDLSHSRDLTWWTYGMFSMSLEYSNLLPIGAGLIGPDGGIRRTGVDSWRTMNLDEDTRRQHQDHIHIEYCAGRANC